MALIPNNSVLSNPLNAPNADTQTDTSSLYDWINKAPADVPVTEPVVAENTQPTTTSDLYNFPEIETNKDSNLQKTVQNKNEVVTAASLRKKLSLYDMSTYDVYNQQLKIEKEQEAKEKAELNKNAFFTERDLNNPIYAAANVSLGFLSGVVELASGVGQFVPSLMKDDYAESQYVEDFLTAETDLTKLLSETTDPQKRSVIEQKLKAASDFLDTPYDTELAENLAVLKVAADEAVGTWREDAALDQYNYFKRQLPTHRSFRKTAASQIKGADAVYDYFEEVSKGYESFVNKEKETDIVNEVKPFAAKAAQSWEDGDVVSSVGTMAEGIFTVALDNPQGAITMFATSLPQMIAIANPYTAPAAVTAAYNKHADDMMAKYVEQNGNIARNKNKEFIQLGAVAATMFDFFSDKVAMKGLDLIPVKMLQKITTKLGQAAPKGLKTVTEYGLNASGRVAGLALQPAQEFISGAGTELSEQAGVAGTITGDAIDATKVIEQGMIEAVAVSPVQAVDITARTFKKGRALVAKSLQKATDVGSVLQEQAELAEVILQSTVVNPVETNADATIEGEVASTEVPAETAEAIEANPVVKFIQFTASNSFKDLPLTEKTLEKTEEYMNQFNELFQEAADFHETNPGVANEVELAFLKNAQATNEAAGALYNNLTKEDTTNAANALQDVAARLAEVTSQDLADPVKFAELKDSFLGSIDLRNVSKEDGPTAEELEVAREKLQLSVEEAVEIDAYIALRKSYETVSTEIKSADADGKGIAYHINEVVRAVTAKNVSAANGRLQFYGKWVDYQRFKVNAFKEIKKYNALSEVEKNEQGLPAGITLIDGPTATGQINKFTITYDTFAFDKHDKSKVQVWFFNDTIPKNSPPNTEGAATKLIREMETDQAALESAYTALEVIVSDDFVNKKTKPINVQPVDTVTAPTVDPIVTENNAGTTNVNEVEVESTPSTNEVVDTSVDNSVADTTEVVAEEVEVELSNREKNIQRLQKNVTELEAKEEGNENKSLKLRAKRKQLDGYLNPKTENENNVALIEARLLKATPGSRRAVELQKQLDEYTKLVAEEKSTINTETTVPVVETPAVPAVEESSDSFALTAEDIASIDPTSPENIQNQADIDVQVNAFNESNTETVVEEETKYALEEELFGTAQLNLDQVAATVEGGVPNEAAFVLDEDGNQVDLQGTNTLAENFDAKNTTLPETVVLEETTTDEFADEFNSNAENTQEVTTPVVIEGSYFKRIRNFFESVPEELSKLNLSETEVEVLNELARLNKKLTSNLSTVIEALKDPKKPYTPTSGYAVNGTKNTLIQNPMLMLAKAITVGSKAKRAYFDPNIVSMMNLTAINWLVTQGASTLFNDSDSIKRVLRAESNVAKTSDETLREVRFAGTMYTTLVESLGKEIYKQLPLKLKESTPVLLKERFIVSLGETAVENLISAGLLDKKGIEADKLFNNGGKAIVFFVRIPTKGKESLEPTERVNSIFKINKGKKSVAYKSLIKKISGTEIRAKLPAFKAKVLKKTATYYKSLRLLPKRVRDDINIANAVKWKIKPDMEYLLQPENREEATEFFMGILGYEPNVTDRPLALQAGDLGRNLGIMSEIEGVFDFYDVYLDNNKEAFNFSYNTGENARHTVNESGFSYQSSKLVRHIISAQDSKQKNDGFTVVVPLNNAESLIFNNFKYAIVQALSTDVSIDKDTDAVILKEFDKLANDSIIKAAAKNVFEQKYLDKSINTLEMFGGTVAENNINAAELIGQLGVGAHGFDGLTALGNYLNAIDTESTEFSTDITIETDAITSGVMLTLLNFGAIDAESIRKLNSGGIFLDNYNTLTEHRRSNKEDVYTMLVEPWKKQATLISLEKPEYAAILELIEINRNTAKPIIMQGSYMANFSSLVNNFVSGTKDGQINALYQRLYEGTTAEKIAIYKSLAKLVHPSNTTAAKSLYEKLYVEDSLLNTQELPSYVLTTYENALKEVYGEALTDILNKDEGMRPNATAINQMVNMVSWYYRFKIKKAIDAAGGYQALTEQKLLEIYEDPALADLVPYLPTPDSIARGEGLNGLVTTNFRDSSDDSNVVKQDLNRPGVKSVSSRSSRKELDNASARSFVVSVQSIDDAIIRAVMRKMKVMSAFDALYSSIGTAHEGSKIYNENVLEIAKSFSIFEETHTNYTKSMSALKKSGEFNELVQFMYDDTNKFDENNQLVDKYLFDPSQPSNLSDITDPTTTESITLARKIFTKMQSDLNERNETIKKNREELFSRIRTVDHMGMPGTYINIAPGTEVQGTLPGVAIATQEEKDTAKANKAAKRSRKQKTKPLPQSMFARIAELGGINNWERFDGESITAGSQAGNKKVFVSENASNGKSMDFMLRELQGEFLNLTDLNEFDDLLDRESRIYAEGDVLNLTYSLNSLEEIDQLREESRQEEQTFEDQQQKEDQEEADKESFLNPNQDDSLGSIPNNDDTLGYVPLAGIFVDDATGGLRASSLQQIFDIIGSNSNSGVNSNNHINHLRGILNRVISKVVIPADNLEIFVRTQGDTSYGKQRDNKVYINIGASLPKNLVNPSAKESYVHELVHVITRAALSDPKANNIVRKLNKVMNETVAILEKKYNGEAWKVFLKRDSQGNPIYAISQLEEEKAAKEAFDYIFNNTQMAETATYDADSKKGQVIQTRAGLHEFLAYALTNESLNSALADEKISTYSSLENAETIFGKIIAILENVLTWAENALNKSRYRVGGAKPGNTAELVEQMVHELTITTDAYQFRSRRIMEALTTLNQKTSALARAKIGVPGSKKVEKARYTAILNGNKYKYIALTYIGFINPVTREKIRDELDTLRAGIRISKRNFIVELYREIAGNIDVDQRVMERLLLQSRQSLDAQRDEAINAIANSIAKHFTGTLANEESEASTRIFIESDFTVLINDWANVDLLDLAAYLTDDAKRDKAIKDVRQQLKQYGSVGNYYIGQALSLGSIMAQGYATVEGTRLNATLIARADDVADIASTKIPKEIDQVVELIDRLATLESIGLNTKSSRDLTANILIREHAIDPVKNGAVNILTLIDEHKKQSYSRNFESNKALQIKGYAKEISDPDISIITGLLSEEKDYADMGYKLVGTTSTDTDDTGMPKEMGIYQNRTGGHAPRQKFILSVTNTQMKGQSIRKRASEEGGKDAYLEAEKKIKKIQSKNKIEARKLLRNPDYVSPKKNILVPVTDQLGNVTDYRYLMSKAKKARLLNQKAGIEMILSKMYGSIIDKEETPRINNEVIKEIYEQYLTSTGKQTGDFVEISLNAVDEKGRPNQEYREIYQILPDSTKRYIRELTGENKIMVKAEFVDIVFGRKKIRLPGNDEMQKIYGAWFEFVAGAKKNIVIKWPATLIMNVISNTMFGLMYGVPIEFMFKKQAEGAIKLNNYIQDIKQLNDLKLELVVATKTNSTADIQKINVKIAEVQTNINTSPILPLIKGGAFQTIVEDVDVLKDPYGYATKISDFFGEIQGRGGKSGATVGGARQAYKYAYMSDETAVFKALMKTTQFSDFAARYAKYEYMTKFQKMEESDAMEVVMEDFINYETPTNKYIQFANDSGAQMFTKYGFRILRVIAALMQGRPLNAMAFLLINDILTTDIPSPFDVTPFDNSSGLASLVLAGTTPSGIKLVDDTIDMVTPN